MFPNPEALLRLAGAVLVEIHDEWAVTDRRYLSEGFMNITTTATKEVAHPAALTMPSARWSGCPFAGRAHWWPPSLFMMRGDDDLRVS